MEDKEFVMEAIQRLVPDSMWHGETNSDKESLKAIDVEMAVLEHVLYLLTEHIQIPGQEWNASAKAIMEKKKACLKSILEEDIGDLTKLVGYKLVPLDKEAGYVRKSLDAISFVEDRINVLKEDLGAENDKAKRIFIEAELSNYENIRELLMK